MALPNLLEFKRCELKNLVKRFEFQLDMLDISHVLTFVSMIGILNTMTIDVTVVSTDDEPIGLIGLVSKEEG